jgi:hypothetical protein
MITDDLSRRSNAFARAAALFNEGAFFEAHEVWENLWIETSIGPERTLFQGLIQVAAAFHKFYGMHNATSAARILRRACAKLDAVVAMTPNMDGEARRFGIEDLEELARVLRKASEALARGDAPAKAPPLRLTLRRATDT